jgi:C1A family cysteine protease
MLKGSGCRSSTLGLILLGLLVLSYTASAQGPDLVEAPTPPGKPASGSPQTGFVPPPMDLSHLRGRKAPGGLAATAVPSSWDWRDEGKVTPVRNQGGCGSCYAFAAVANLESRVLVDGAGGYDFSENHAKECNWYELTGTHGGTSCSGGNYWQLVNLFSKNGTVLESCDPYVASDVACNSSCAYQKTLLDWRIISGSAMPSPEVLKQYIYDHGPIYTTIYAGSGDAWRSEFGSYNGSYTLYYTGGGTPNHAVMIVGWDDGLTHAGGSGGWIVKNSWGTGWGDDGHFTIAYGSASIGKYSSFAHTWQDHDDDGEVLYYDEGGWASSWGCKDSATAWGLVRFTPTSDATVARVEIWTSDATSDVDVYVYDAFDGGGPSNLLAQELNRSFDEAGYHSVPLSLPVSVSAGDDVVAVVKFANVSYPYPVTVDSYGPHEIGRTYLSCSGDGWTDMGSYAGHDVAIRLRTGSDDAGCGDPHEPNDSRAQATPIGYGDALTDPDICPAGDEDVYAFSGSAGDVIAADVDAGSLSPPAALDATLALLDAGGSEIAASDDHDGVDPRLEVTLPADGTYYLRVREHDHPDEGGPAYVYALSLNACYWADLNCDCAVSAADIQAVAGAWRCEDGAGCYDARYDLDGDGVVTVVDIMRVAAEWNWSCS